MDRLFTMRPDALRMAGVALVLVALNAMGALLFAVDLRLPVVLLMATVGMFVAVESPLAGVALLLAGRLTSTGANAWVRIGRINIDLFEPSLLLVLTAVLFHAASRKNLSLPDAPWRAPVLVLFVWQVIGLAWTTNLTEGIQDVVATGVLLATTFVILTFVKSWDHVRWISFVWVGVSAIVALLSITGIATPSETAQFEMSSGNRAGGFGQQPNWFAMNLMYGVMLAVAYAVIEKKASVRAWMVGAGMLIFLGQMTSGSRGGTASVLIGAGIAGLFHPRLRKMVIRVGAVGGLAVAAVILGDGGAATAAFSRIWVDSSSAGALGAGVRESNWLVCWEMFVDTWGRGIGPGGYADLLMQYNYWLYNSQYTYPHGIFWGLMANYGVVGIACLLWFLYVIYRMTRDMVDWTKGRPEQIVVFAMLGTMIGYFAWSFFEFLYDEKPFWEFLGLYTVVWTLMRQRSKDEAERGAEGAPERTDPVVETAPTEAEARAGDASALTGAPARRP